MKKSELMQYRDLIFEIRKLENRIRKNERKIERDSVSGSNPDFPYEPMIFKIEGYGTYSERNKRLRAILEQRKNQAEELKIRIEEFIAQIPDCRTRLIFISIHART